jgi:hypothetical protein
MSNYVWLVENREWAGEEMVCTILDAASTLQIAEHFLRFSPGLKETNCWYAIYPVAIDHEFMGTKPYPPEVLADEGHFILNFYDEDFNQIEQQPQRSECTSKMAASTQSYSSVSSSV